MKEENLTDIINEEINNQNKTHEGSVVHDDRRTFFTMPENYSETIEENPQFTREEKTPEQSENQFNHDLLKEESKVPKEQPTVPSGPQEIKEELTFLKADENTSDSSSEIKQKQLRVIQRDRDASLENQQLIKDRMTIGWLILNAAVAQRITKDNSILVIKNKLKATYSDKVFESNEKNLDTVASAINLASNILLTKLFSKETLHLEAENILKKMNTANYKEEEAT